MSRSSIARAILICVCLLAFFANATEYYVANDGLDTNAGTAPDAPWQTLDRVNAGPFLLRDRILFRRGDLWRGALVPFSGDETAPGYYGACGKREKPLLLGSVDVNRPEVHGPAPDIGAIESRE